jgi:uncharacterized membrane protein YoaT (DUF817 family)
MRRFTSLEARIDVAAHRILAGLPQTGVSGAAIEFLVFGLKQAWACLFGGAMLGLILLTRLYWPEAMPLARYDFLFLAALFIQVGMVWTKLESLEEAKVIFIFHVVGTIMEIFKTGAGSWLYPEPSLFHIAGVPLFSGFMYACIGSFMTRILRIFDIRFIRYPPLWTTVALGAAIYVNFFSHHFIWDLRYPLFAATAALFLRTNMHYRVFRYWHSMPILLAFLLTATFIWFAENIGTWSRAWIYPGQADGWAMVSFEKLGSWYLLMIISVVLITVVHPPRMPDVAIDSEAVGANVADAIPPQNI